MKTHEAEKLLGGYAAGILTDAEKTLLFSAALEHQELFDALADEEALRELLADPENRRHLLALLSEPEARKPITLWRRPAVVGLAASLFAMVTTSLVLWQREKPAQSMPVAQEKAAEPKRLSAALTEEDAAPGKLMAKRSAGPSVPPSAPTKGDRQAEAMAPAAPAPPQANLLAEASPSIASQEGVMKAEEAQDHRYEAKKQTTDRAKAAAAVEVVATTQAMDTRETATRVAISKDSLEQLPAKRTVIGGVALAPGVAAGGVQPFKKATPAKNLLVRARIPAPTHVLERLAQGRMRLTVTWASGNHLYVLRRTDSHILVLAPSTTSPAKAGAIVSTFEFSLGTKDHVDLYLLPQPATDPESLPAEGVLEGYRKRVL